MSDLGRYLQNGSGWDRDTLLPLARKIENGQIVRGSGVLGSDWHLATPGMLADMLKAAAAVGNSSLTTPPVMDDQSRQEMIEGAGAWMGPQMAVKFASGMGRSAASPLDSRAIMSRANEAGYAPKPQPQRPFEHDYRGPVEGVDGSLLKTDIEGRPLTAKFVAGRQRVGENDVALTPAQVAEVARDIGSVEFVPRQELPRRSVGSYLPITNEMKIAADLPSDQAAIALSHELGHGLAESARVPIDLAGSAVAARKVYHDLRTGDTSAQMPGKFHSPELDGYAKSDVGSELRAELMRAYMTDPNYLKTMAPKAAASIRASINSDPWLSKIIQFNAPPGTLVVPGGLAAYLMGTDRANEP